MKLSLEIHNLTKSYGKNIIFSGLNLSLSAPNSYCLMAPSGTGKTTLFRILMGLEKPDSGSIRACDLLKDPPCRIPLRELCISSVFQEDRLIEFMTPLENAALVLPGKADREELISWFSRLLPKESLFRPVSTLSGGMRRRCALMRALLAPSSILLLDEPFTGLDDETKKTAIRCLLDKADGRLILTATHSRDDAALLNASIIELPESVSL